MVATSILAELVVLAADVGPYTLAVVVVAAIVAITIITRTSRSIQAGYKGVEFTIGEVHKKVNSIDKQVNQVPDDEVTIRQLLTTQTSQLAEVRGDVADLQRGQVQAAKEAAEAKRLAAQAAETGRANNVLLTQHIAQSEAQHAELREHRDQVEPVHDADDDSPET